MLFQCLILQYEKGESPVAFGCTRMNVSGAVLLQSELRIAAGLKGQELGDEVMLRELFFYLLVLPLLLQDWMNNCKFHKVQHFFFQLMGKLKLFSSDF